MRLGGRFLLLPVCFAALAAGAQSPAPKTITIRMLDSKTGTLIATSNFLVRVNHREEEHGDWARQAEDGAGKLMLPANANDLAVHATYESATLTYVNCDSDKDRASAEHAASLDRWYSVEQILASGVVAPNNCAGKKIPEKLQVVAEPGEFVFFVRPMNPRERFRE
jgi:hypothetical protein